ncbi:MAG TPA: YciI family protein [Bacteroidota bacterium]
MSLKTRATTVKEFMFVFRRNPDSEKTFQSPEKMQALWKAWQDWTESLVAQNRLAGTGKRLGTDGKVVNPKRLVTNGPYVELKETVAGYMFVYANTIDEAVEIAKASPNLTMGGTVEVRPVVSENNTA